MKIIVWSLPGITDLDHDAAQIKKSVRASGFMNQKAKNSTYVDSCIKWSILSIQIQKLAKVFI